MALWNEWSGLQRLLALKAAGIIGGGASFVWQTATGSLPLTLTNAVAKRIKSLVQYGKVKQASTPAPSAPQSITINNGVLRLVDDELPIGYRRLASITYAANTYYDTGHKLYGSDTITITCQPSITSGQNLFGAYKSADAVNYSLYAYGSTSTGWYFRYGETLYRPKTDNTKRTLIVGPGETSGFSTNVTVAYEEFETDAVAWIGALPNSTSAKYSGTLYGDITVGTRLRWIPCERESDGVIGYYEIVNGEFLEPNGDTPVAGAYDYSHAHIAVVGTGEVLTVSGTDYTQTASVEDLYSVGDITDEHDIISGTVTHKVGIKVFDGSETFSKSSAYGKAFLINAAYAAWGADRTKAVMCTHFLGLPQKSSTQDDNTCFFNSTGHFYFRVTDNSDTDAFKAWLAEQYAAGTPIIVLFVLSESTTESVTAQHLATAQGDNSVSAVSNVDPVTVAVEYAGVST